jgi:uncharacterized protein YjaZ
MPKCDALTVAQLRINGHKALIIYERELQKVLPSLKSGLIKASRLLATKNDIVIDVAPTSDKFIRDKMGGASGVTADGHLMRLSVDTGSKAWKSAAEGTVAHEYAHIVRFQTASGVKHDLAEAIVTEGIAQCFEEAITGTLRPWSQAITIAQAKRILPKIKSRLNERSRDFGYRLFLSRNDKEFPHWSGYTISYLLIRKRLSNLGDVDWNDIIKKRQKALLKNCVL